MSHLHFDHAGGILSSFDEGPLHLVFKRAQYFVGAVAWERALTPHRRDRASYIPELNRLLKASGQLKLIPDSMSNSELRDSGFLTSSMGLSRSDGHSPGMSLFTFTGQRGRAAFCADLIPGLPWFRTAITMGYDRFPEQLIDEKLRFLAELGPGAVLLFTHDPKVAAVQLIAPAGAEDALLQAGIQVNDFQVWNLDHCEVPRFSSPI